jgi:thiol-disulfide isomerase/thioredoxin
LADDVRARPTLQLAIEIRRLPAKPSKLRLAENLAALSTEGDFGHDTLQEVATTLAGAIRENPLAAAKDQAFMPYAELAQLVRYEHVQADLEDPQFKAALAQLEADDARRQKADFTLTDLQGKAWTLKRLTGKVVLVNFWATWCPPCRKEMPDLQALHEQFRDQLVVLAISDEEADRVEPFIAGRNVTYPILLDPGRKVNELFGVQGIPRSFVYDREEKLVAQAIDMRTRRQFLEMLEQAGLH